MRYPCLVHRFLCGILVVGAAGVLSAALPERKTFQFGEFTIEASAGDDAYVEALALRLVDCKLPAEPALAPVKLTVGGLALRRDYFLGKVSGFLGLAKPTASMESAYDGFVLRHKTLGEGAPITLPRHFVLWRQSEIISRIDAGERVEGFRKEGIDEVNYFYDLNLGPAPGEAGDKFICPIKIAVEPGKTPAADVADGLEASLSHSITVLRDYRRHAEYHAVFVLLHETAKAGVTSYLTSMDRCWFCNGLANYAAWKVIEAEVGVVETRAYYDLAAALKRYASEAPQIDLATWLAVENQDQLQYSEKLDTANQAFATQVIADVCAKQGKSVLPKLLGEIGKTKKEKATMDTVYRAYKRLTNEDLRSYLPKS